MTGLYAATIRKKLNWEIEDMAWYLNITPLSVEAVEKYGPTKSIEEKLVRLEEAIERKDVGLQTILFRVRSRATRAQFGKGIGASRASVCNLERGLLGPNSKVRKDAEKMFEKVGVDLSFLEEEEQEDDDFDIEYYKANAEMWKQRYFQETLCSLSASVQLKGRTAYEYKEVGENTFTWYELAGAPNKLVGCIVKDSKNEWDYLREVNELGVPLLDDGKEIPGYADEKWLTPYVNLSTTDVAEALAKTYNLTGKEAEKTSIVFNYEDTPVIMTKVGDSTIHWIKLPSGD